MTIYGMVTVGICLVMAVLAIFCLIRNYAGDSIGELQYMLKCTKERRKVIPDDCITILQKNKAEIAYLEKRIENHWGRRLIGKHRSKFNFIPTPEKKFLMEELQKDFEV